MQPDCSICGEPFAPARPTSTTCSARCRNTETARKTAAARGDKLRGRGAGRAKYRKRGGRHEHRVVAEEKLGRPLAPGETVHHLNTDGHDNREENLAVLGSQSEHARLHEFGRDGSHNRKYVIGQACLDCDAQAVNRGYCNRHYQRRYRAGTL